jgi:hypothetical protein
MFQLNSIPTSVVFDLANVIKIIKLQVEIGQVEGNYYCCPSDFFALFERISFDIYCID